LPITWISKGTSRRVTTATTAGTAASRFPRASGGALREPHPPQKDASVQTVKVQPNPGFMGTFIMA